MAKEYIRDFYGKVLGSIETDYAGNKVVRDFYGKVLGTYKKSDNTTRNFYGRIVAKGDQSSMLLAGRSDNK